MLRSIHANRAKTLPLKVFEVGDVFGKKAGTETGAANRRILAAMHCDTVTSFEVFHLQNEINDANIDIDNPRFARQNYAALANPPQDRQRARILPQSIRRYAFKVSN